jgi:hypothetical protein
LLGRAIGFDSFEIVVELAPLVVVKVVIQLRTEFVHLLSFAVVHPAHLVGGEDIREVG